MSQFKIEGLKGSEVLRIEAAILGYAEKVSSEVELDTELMPGVDEGTLQITLRFSNPEWDKLNELRTRLGIGFTPRIFGKGKSGIFFLIVGNKESFEALLKFTSSQPTLQHGAQISRQ